MDDGATLCNSYTWDRANRLLSMGGASYAYDGVGNRISQTIGVDVTQYLLDLQPGLATVLQSTQGSDTTRYLHAPRGIHKIGLNYKLDRLEKTLNVTRSG